MIGLVFYRGQQQGAPKVQQPPEQLLPCERAMANVWVWLLCVAAVVVAFVLRWPL